MNVPFISSGALSRAHYALVRKVEEATSEAPVNGILEAEVNSIRAQMAQPGLSHKKTKEELIMLLYCSMTATSPIFPNGAFDFALPHAIGLAEAGATVEGKRIGYLFCAEIMRPDHEMRLLLVNTLRKDLEDDSPSRICLALDNIILTSFADIIPAVQSRLYDLLSHNHPSVRRRTLYALRSLSHHEPELLSHTHSKILRRLGDRDESVVCAALKVAETSFHMNPQLATAIQDTINDIFESGVQAYSPTGRKSIIVSLGVVHGVGLRILSLPTAFDLLASCSHNHDTMTMMGLYPLFKKFDAATLHPIEEQSQISLIGTIRDYLTSRMPNEIYLFLSCLESVDSSLWAGTSETIPPVLEAQEVEHIMQLLDSNDDLIRKKTLHLLREVDQGILSTYYTQAISATTRIALPFRELNERTRRLLEVLEIISEDNGEFYASQVRDLLTQVEPHIAGHGILDSGIDGVLTHIRLNPSFRISCVATMLTFLCDVDAEFGPTMVIILAALAAEYSRLVSLPPTELLSGICHRLKGSLPVVQEPCLLAMLRITADCENPPEGVAKTVSEVAQNAGRHIRRRCNQFLTLSDQKDNLMEIVVASRSFTLPDFSAALELHSGNAKDKADRSSPEAKFPQASPRPTRTATSGTSANKLRYEAYDPPQTIPSLRTHHVSNRQGIAKPGSVGGRLSNLYDMEPVAPTISETGDLPPIVPTDGSTYLTEPEPELTANVDVEHLGARVDLIAFDSPSVMEQPDNGDGRTENLGQELDFKKMWNSVDKHWYCARGWCDATLDNVIRRLEGIQQHQLHVVPIDVLPFIGDLKIMVVPDGRDGAEKAALVRLSETDEDGRVWRLRCREEVLRDQVKGVLSDV